MSDRAIAAMIREVLAEELEKLGGRPRLAARKPVGPVREEKIAIASDAELAAFVARLLKLADDKKARAEIAEGRLVFRFAGGDAAAPAQSQPVPKAAAPAKSAPKADPAPPPAASSGDGAVVVEAGFFSERQAHQLPSGTKLVKVGKSVRLTPLARDRLAHRGIRIERMEA